MEKSKLSLDYIRLRALRMARISDAPKELIDLLEKAQTWELISKLLTRLSVYLSDHLARVDIGLEQLNHRQK